jgi:hypothetical protein
MARIMPVLRDAHPDSPWLWREDWASGRIRSSQGAAAAVYGALAAGFAGSSVPLVLKAPELVHKDGIGVVLMPGLFPLVAILIGSQAALATVRWLRFRGTWLELQTLPGVVGGSLRATLHTGRVIEPKGDFRVRLSRLTRTQRGKETADRAFKLRSGQTPGYGRYVNPNGDPLTGRRTPSATGSRSAR